MKRVVVGLALALLSFGCSTESATVTSGVAKVEARVGAKAPKLDGVSTSGEPIRLSDYRGKVVLVDFWATWCGPCVALIPHEKELVARMAGRPFAFIGVSADHDREELQEFIVKNQLPWPNIFDEGKKLGRTWQVEFLPTIFLIDADGVIRHKFIGASRELDAAVDKLVTQAEARTR
jgi:peroxiredoxin